MYSNLHTKTKGVLTSKPQFDARPLRKWQLMESSFGAKQRLKAWHQQASTSTTTSSHPQQQHKVVGSTRKSPQ